MPSAFVKENRRCKMVNRADSKTVNKLASKVINKVGSKAEVVQMNAPSSAV